MRISSLPRLCRHGLSALALALATSCALAEDAARVDFAAGEATVTTAAGESRALKKGDMIAGGDRIETGRGRVQLRFADGAYVALQPNTVFRVDQYLYANQPANQQSAFFSLVKGGMRTVTGTIGKANRDNYKVKTPVATIGIRGTGYSALQTGSQLLVSVNAGLVAVLNDLGETLAGAGQNVAVTPDNQPSLTTEQVHFNGQQAAADHDEQTGATDEGDTEDQTATTDSETSTTTVVADTSYTPPINPCPDLTCNDVSAIEKAIGQPVQSNQPLHLVVARNGITAKGNYFEQGSDKLVVTAITVASTTPASTATTATSAEQLLRAELENGGARSNYLSRADVNSPWAREIDTWRGNYIRGASWNGGDYLFLNNTSPSTLSGGQFLHYVGGELAPVASVDSLVTQGAKLDYKLLGASSANNAAGTQNFFLDGNSLLRVNFLDSKMAVYLNLINTNTQGGNFIIDQSGNIQWQAYGTNNHDARFNLAFTTASTDSNCMSCSVNISGFFAGPAAAEIGLGYTIGIPVLADTLEGTAGFGNSGVIPQGLFIAYARPANRLIPDYHGEYVTSGNPVFHPVEDSNGLLSGDQAGTIRLSRAPNLSLIAANPAAQTVQGVSNGLHWGSWGPGSYQYTDISGSPAVESLSGGQRLHYVYGDLTSLADMANLAQVNAPIRYGLVAATAVTDPNGSLAAGTLDPSSGFTFNFSLGTFGAHLQFNNYAGATSPVAIDNPDQALTWLSNNDARFTAFYNQIGCVSVCDNVHLTGFFSGNQAQNLGVAYNAAIGPNQAAGAAVFTKVP